MQSNYEIFKSHMNNLVVGNKKYENTKKYKSEIELFQKYLEEENLVDRVFVLSKEDIDNYFIYCMNKNKLNAQNTLNTHISAIKSIFEYLIEKKQRFDELFGYVSTQEFRINISNKLREVKSKELISMDTIQKSIISIDKYIELTSVKKSVSRTEKDRILKAYFVRLFMKMSLVLPIKLSEMLEIDIDMFDDEFRSFTYNEFKVNISNSLRSNIIETLSYMSNEYSEVYVKEDKLFRFIAKPLKQVNTAYVSEWFYTVFNTVDLIKLFNNSNSRSFPVEKIKKCAIWNMLNNGINIIHLSDYTGLGIEMLLADGIFSYDKDRASSEINSSLSNVQYYNYL